MGCYRYELIKGDGGPGYFGEAVDAVYVLILEGTKREPAVRRQLAEHTLAPKMWLQFNKGYRCGKPELPEKKSNYDIVHAVVTACRHARDAGYRRILVLEDDFVVERNCEADAKEVCRFVNESEPWVYSMGSVTFGFPLALHRRMFGVAGGAQAVIYNRDFIDWIIENYDSGIERRAEMEHADAVLMEPPGTKYTFCRPLITQTYELTENQTTWPDATFVPRFVKLLGLHNSTKHFGTLCSIVMWTTFVVAVLFAVILICTIGIALGEHGRKHGWQPHRLHA